MISPKRKEQLLFAHDVVRQEQNKLLLLTDASIKNNRNLIVHAPTGLGKTAATIGPALANALESDKTVLFLTSRHTQHKIAIETLQTVKERFSKNFSAVSFIGKKWMCLQPGAEKMYSSEFANYCKKLREEKKCNFYMNARKNPNKFTMQAQALLKDMQKYAPLTSEQVVSYAQRDEMCPYEMALGMAKAAKVIISDYYYLFHPNINDSFLTKIGRTVDELIVIVDEAHNLPYRLKDLASEYLSSIILKRAIKEANKYGYDNVAEVLEFILEQFEKLGTGMGVGDEKKLDRFMFYGLLDKAYGYEQIVDDFNYVGDAIRELQKTSYVGSVALFLEAWQGGDEGFVRILSYKKGMREPYYVLSYRCMDPAVIARQVINDTQSTILMSGTLLPTEMYRELLGVERVQEVVFKDPFPKSNRLNLVVPKTTTKYAKRSEDQFRNIAEELTRITKHIPGNVAVFFPSYYVKERVNEFFAEMSEKTVFSEKSELTKSQRLSMIERFKEYKDIGAVLLGVAAGSFGEGIDLPGDFLQGVIIVGLPLSAPDLETKSLIKYYDKKFGKGWDYGYLYPAFNKSLQNAGRCIRSGTDKGAIVFLDERYVWNNYKRCFPEDWDMAVSTNYVPILKEFFS